MSKQELPLDIVQRWAEEVRSIIAPFCTEAIIAGSIRRKKSFVGDIEICVLLDRTKVVPFSNMLYEQFKVGMKRESRYIKFPYQRTKVDLFIPQESDFIRQTIIRTGSADFVHKKVANAWRRSGWVGTDDGLRREAECTFVFTDKAKLKKKWTCTSTGSNISLPPLFKTEQDFFGFLGLPYTPPEQRF